MVHAGQSGRDLLQQCGLLSDRNKYVGGNIYARRREDGQYILIPPQKVERNRDNPDGRNHLCAPPPNSYHPTDTVFCFSLGGGT